MDINAPFDKVAKAWAPKPKGHRGNWDSQVTCVECIEELDEVHTCHTYRPVFSTGFLLIAILG